MPRILIAEDDPASAALTKSVLSRWNCQVAVVSDGKQAVEAARREMPDLILMDMRMPVMDGDEACWMIKTQAETAHIPVVFVSAANRPVDRARGLLAGGDGYVVKPYDPEHLMHLLTNLLKTRACLEEMGPASAGPPPAC